MPTLSTHIKTPPSSRQGKSAGEQKSTARHPRGGRRARALGFDPQLQAYHDSLVVAEWQRHRGMVFVDPVARMESFLLAKQRLYQEVLKCVPNSAAAVQSWRGRVRSLGAVIGLAVGRTTLRAVISVWRGAARGLDVQLHGTSCPGGGLDASQGRPAGGALPPGAPANPTCMGERSSSPIAMGERTSNPVMGEQTSNLVMGEQTSNRVMEEQTSNLVMEEQTSSPCGEFDRDLELFSHFHGGTSYGKQALRRWFDDNPSHMNMPPHVFFNREDQVIQLHLRNGNSYAERHQWRNFMQPSGCNAEARKMTRLGDLMRVSFGPGSWSLSAHPSEPWMLVHRELPSLLANGRPVEPGVYEVTLDSWVFVNYLEATIFVEVHQNGWLPLLKVYQLPWSEEDKVTRYLTPTPTCKPLKDRTRADGVRGFVPHCPPEAIRKHQQSHRIAADGVVHDLVGFLNRR